MRRRSPVLVLLLLLQLAAARRSSGDPVTLVMSKLLLGAASGLRACLLPPAGGERDSATGGWLLSLLGSDSGGDCAWEGENWEVRGAGWMGLVSDREGEGQASDLRSTSSAGGGRSDEMLLLWPAVCRGEM